MIFVKNQFCCDDKINLGQTNVQTMDECQSSKNVEKAKLMWKLDQYFLISFLLLMVSFRLCSLRPSFLTPFACKCSSTTACFGSTIFLNASFIISSVGLNFLWGWEWICWSLLCSSSIKLRFISIIVSIFCLFCDLISFLAYISCFSLSFRIYSFVSLASLLASYLCS